MKKQDILENQANIVFLAIGSNLGNKKKILNNAKYNNYLKKIIKILKSSSFYETKSWPNKSKSKIL